MILMLTRQPVQPAAYCTMGELQIPDGPKFYTVELPWVPAAAGIHCGLQGLSCIGLGIYRLEPRETEARGYHWILSNPELRVYRQPREVPAGVYARSLILIHAANWAHELLGCIAPGKDKGVIGIEWGVAQSRAAMLELRVAIGHNPGELQLEIH